MTLFQPHYSLNHQPATCWILIDWNFLTSLAAEFHPVWPETRCVSGPCCSASLCRGWSTCWHPPWTTAVSNTGFQAGQGRRNFINISKSFLQIQAVSTFCSGNLEKTSFLNIQFPPPMISLDRKSRASDVQPGLPGATRCGRPGLGGRSPSRWRDCAGSWPSPVLGCRD